MVRQPNKSNRRTYLKRIAGTFAGLALGTGRAAAQPDPTEDSPLNAVTGRRIRKYRPEGEYFDVTERFVSPRLKDLYGKGTIVYDEGKIHRERVPPKYKNPDRPITISETDSALIGTLREQRAFEKHYRSSQSSEITIASHTDPYDGPLFVWKAANSPPSSSDDLGELTGPINVGWSQDQNIYTNAAAINNYMELLGWTSLYAGFPGDRYILNYNSSNGVQVQDEHIVKGLDAPTTQYHVRAYDVPSYGGDNYWTVGQAHRDPFLHDGPPWNFSMARDAVRDTWDNNGFSADLLYIDNGSLWDTSYGYFSKIH